MTPHKHITARSGFAKPIGVLMVLAAIVGIAVLVSQSDFGGRLRADITLTCSDAPPDCGPGMSADCCGTSQEFFIWTCPDPVTGISGCSNLGQSFSNADDASGFCDEIDCDLNDCGSCVADACISDCDPGKTCDGNGNCVLDDQGGSCTGTAPTCAGGESPECCPDSTWSCPETPGGCGNPTGACGHEFCDNCAAAGNTCAIVSGSCQCIGVSIPTGCDQFCFDCNASGGTCLANSVSCTCSINPIDSCPGTPEPACTGGFAAECCGDTSLGTVWRCPDPVTGASACSSGGKICSDDTGCNQAAGECCRSGQCTTNCFGTLGGCTDDTGCNQIAGECCRAGQCTLNCGGSGSCTDHNDCDPSVGFCCDDITNTCIAGPVGCGGGGGDCTSHDQCNPSAGICCDSSSGMCTPGPVGCGDASCPAGSSCSSAIACMGQGGTCVGGCGGFENCCCDLGGSGCTDDVDCTTPGECCNTSTSQCTTNQIECDGGIKNCTSASDCSSGDCCLGGFCSSSCNTCFDNTECFGGECCNGGVCSDTGCGDLCGDDKIDPDEECDEGDDNGQRVGTECVDYICYSDCTLPTCGDLVQNFCSPVTPPEGCDDGKHCANGAACTSTADCSDSSECITRSGDGCSDQCIEESGCCADRNLCTGIDECNLNSCGCETPTCESSGDCSQFGNGSCCLGGTCAVPECGDGLVQCGEQCEPSNSVKKCRVNGQEFSNCFRNSASVDVGQTCDIGLCLNSGNGIFTCNGASGGMQCGSDDVCIGSCVLTTTDPCCNGQCQSTPNTCPECRDDSECDFGECCRPDSGGLNECTKDCGGEFCGDDSECNFGECCDEFSGECTTDQSFCGGFCSDDSGCNFGECCDESSEQCTTDQSFCGGFCSDDSGCNQGAGECCRNNQCVTDCGTQCQAGFICTLDNPNINCNPGQTLFCDGTCSDQTGNGDCCQCRDDDSCQGDSDCNFGECCNEGTGECSVDQQFCDGFCSDDSGCNFGECCVNNSCSTDCGCSSDSECDQGAGECCNESTGECAVDQQFCDGFCSDDSGCNQGAGECCRNNSCTTSCSSVCGNDIEEFPTEQCDDGNTDDGDGCSGTCQLEHACGNGELEFTEGCDDGGTCIAGTNVGAACTTVTTKQDCGLSGICAPQDGDGCDANCQIDECGVIGDPGDRNAYNYSIYNLGKFMDGMYNADTFQSPADPRGLEWFQNQHRTRYGLYTPKGPGNYIHEVPFIGPIDNIPHDPSYFAAKWEGWLNVPALGDYTYFFGTRDDAWVLIDGEVVAGAPGLHDPLHEEQGSIILEPGAYKIEIYYASRTEYQCDVLKELNCGDGRDDDSDGSIDCADMDCAGTPGCGGLFTCVPSETTEVSCSDNQDNDCDGSSDCSDSDCSSDSSCDSGAPLPGLSSVVPGFFEGFFQKMTAAISSFMSTEEKMQSDLQGFFTLPFVEKAYAEEIENSTETDDVVDERSMISRLTSYVTSLASRFTSFINGILPGGEQLLGQLAGEPECSDGFDNDNDGGIDFTPLISRIQSKGWDRIYSILKDEQDGHTYVVGEGTNDVPGIWKIHTDTQQLLGAVSITPPTDYRLNGDGALLDEANNKLYITMIGTPGGSIPDKIFRIDTTTMTHNSLSDVLTLLTGDTNITGAAVLDDVRGYAYWGTSRGLDAKIIQVQLSTFTRTGAVDVDESAGEGFFDDALIDPAGNYALFIGTASPSKVVKIVLSPFARVAGNIGIPVQGSAYANVLHTPSNIAYIGIRSGTPAEVRSFIRVNAATFQRFTPNLSFDTGFGFPRGALIDEPNFDLYIPVTTAGTTVGDARVRKLNLITGTQSDINISGVITTTLVGPAGTYDASRKLLTFAGFPDSVLQVSIAPTDAQCSSSSDNSEGIACDDDFDNDDDGLVDCDDPGCHTGGEVTPTTCDETDDSEVSPICNDGNDNDGDTLIDRGDPGCYDNGNTVTGNYIATDSNETHTVSCGNGAIDQANEECDDGNTTPNDGCSNICQWELHPECLDLYGSPYISFDDIAMTTNGSRALTIKNGSIRWIGIDIDGNITSLGGENLASNAKHGRVTALDDTHFVISYRKLNTPWPNTNDDAAEARPVHIVGDTVILGDPLYIGPNFGPNGHAAGFWFDIDRMSDTRFAVIFRYQSGTESRGYVRIGDIANNTTMSWRTNYNTLPSGELNMPVGINMVGVSGIDADSFIAAYAYPDGSQHRGEVAIGTINGSSITLSGEQSFATKANSVKEIAIDKLTDSHYAITFTEDCLEGATVVLAGGAIDRFEDTWQLCDSDRSGISVAAIDANTHMVAYRDNTAGAIEARVFETGFQSVPTPIHIADGNGQTAVSIAGRAIVAYDDGSKASFCSECQNARDDDNDGFADFGEDVGCRDALDLDERGDCFDTIDNDGDSHSDCDDSACYSTGIVAGSCDRQEAWLEDRFAPRCGDGAIDSGEVCDDGNTVVGDGCNDICQIEECGNGITDANEECDDANSETSDDCPDSADSSGVCLDAECGDGYLWNTQSGTETCDDGPLNGTPQHCNASCDGETAPACGNWFIETGEQCDDGNTNNDDGCSASCQNETLQLCTDTFASGANPGFTISSFDAQSDGTLVVVSGSQARVGTVDIRGNITWVTSASTYGSGTESDVAWLDSTRFVVVERGQFTDGKVRVGERVGTQIQWGSSLQLPLTGNGLVTHVEVEMLHNNKFIAAYRERNSKNINIRIGEVNGRTITLGDERTIGPGSLDSTVIALTRLDAGRFVFANTSTDPFSPGRFVGFAQAYTVSESTIEGISGGVFFRNASGQPAAIDMGPLGIDSFYTLTHFSSRHIRTGTITPTEITYTTGSSSPLIPLQTASNTVRQHTRRIAAATATSIGSTFCEECQNRIDDDDDGFVDFPDDVGCLNTTDDDERNACKDTIDNDNPLDTFIDTADPGCYANGNITIAGDYDPEDNDESHTPECGNGAIDQASENCDDGNLIDGDGCSDTCRITFECNDTVDNDDDNLIDNLLDIEDPGCYSNGNTVTGIFNPNDPDETHTPECGNGAIDQASEECDDGNTNNGDGCDNQCKGSTQCSDNVDNDDAEDTLKDDEDPGCYVNGNITIAADYDANDNNEGHVPECGNGAIDQASEECDDGNLIKGDGCSDTCKNTTQCSDTVDNADSEDTLADILDPGCFDNGNLITGNYVPDDNDESHTEVCGNGLVVLSNNEECDDGNTEDGDGCSSICLDTTQCNDGVDNADTEDVVADEDDPGCHTDGNALNAASYDENDNDEGHAPSCGNGLVDQTSEQCDDGNNDSGDGCSATCQGTAQCNDGVDNGDTEDTLSDAGDPGCYDNGNVKTGNYTPLDNDESHTVVCGNGAIDQASEDCDDGNLVNGDGCNSICKVTQECSDTVDNADVEDLLIDDQDPGCYTGNNTVTGNYQPGDDSEGHIPLCGNGAIDQTSEQCDDGNTINGDGCSETCQDTTACNDDVDNDIDTLTDEDDPGCYDNGNVVTGNYVPSDNDESHPIACGNGAIEPDGVDEQAGTADDQECDDGNLINGDGCSDTCKITVQCSDTVDNADSEDTFADVNDPGCYDNGNVVTGNYVPGDTSEGHIPACGNGAVDQASENCDDGNTDDGDGCSSTCQSTTQCNDGIDNADAEDLVADADDPGCYDNGNVVTGTYNPIDDDETHTPACGNGLTEPSNGEQCDDGNLIAGDGCDENCQGTVACSDGSDNDNDTFTDILDPGCHTDGNALNVATYNPNGITENHTPECGNGAIDQASEQCDDGNLIAGDGCSSTCQNTVQCSDTVDNADAEDTLSDQGDPGCYDNGNIITGNYIQNDNDETHTPECGNGAIDQLSEQCDDGNLIAGDGCDGQCQSTTQCGDSIDNADTEDTLADNADPGCYDNGNVITGNYVAGDNDETHVPACGNGVVDQASEQCDDGNLVNGDGCSSTCQNTVQCSDSVDNADTEDILSDQGDPGCYDNGNVITGNYIAGDNDETHVPACGNGAIDQATEQCDDGNLIAGDGCDDQCQSTTQCSDSLDNEDSEDTLTDSADPGCYDNGNVVTGNYIAGDNDETHTPECGNGAIDQASEQCDDGNTTNGDGCSSTCQNTVQCNDTVDNADSEDVLSDAGDPGCYDNGNVITGNYIAGDNDETHTPACGNGAIDQLSEECDDGNLISGDGCSSTCMETFACSDTYDNDIDGATDQQDPGCYDNENVVTGTYVATDPDESHTPACGNGLTEPINDEQCDDGNLLPADGCSAVCVREECGNAILDPDEECDAGTICSGGAQDGQSCLTEFDQETCFAEGGVCNADTVPDACRTDCANPNCGDDTIDTGEECDDGNRISGDGCSAACVITHQCDDNVDNDDDTFKDAADPGCYDNENTITGTYNPFDEDETHTPACGNGTIDQASEQCDDGNTISIDGCSSTCQFENICAPEDIPSLFYFFFEDPSLIITPDPVCEALGICGDGEINTDLGEECDPGFTCANTSSCMPDGVSCNDGSTCTLRCTEDNLCTNECTIPVCLNGTVECGEECEPEYHGACAQDDNLLCDVANNDPSTGFNPTCLDQTDSCDPRGFCELNPLTICDDDFDCEIPNTCRNILDDPLDSCSLECESTEPACSVQSDCDDEGDNICCLPDGEGGTMCATCPDCGDRVTDLGETCDDGKQCDGDPGRDCTDDPTICGLLGLGQCRPQSGDNCSSMCQTEACGNGIEDPGEQCDDGKQCELDRSIQCQSDETCSDAAICEFDADGTKRCPNGERCTLNSECTDECKQFENDGCDNECNPDVPLICGDGVTTEPEQCDNGSQCDLDTGLDCTNNPGLCQDQQLGLCAPQGGDTCSRFCVNEECGNGIIDPREDCDDGKQCKQNRLANCQTDEECTELARCVTNPDTGAKECADGTICVTHDDCSDTCEQFENDDCNNECEVPPPPFCGDGIVNGDDVCDWEGNVGCEEGFACNLSCTACEEIPDCGNGELDDGENCQNCPADIQCGSGQCCIRSECTSDCPVCNNDDVCNDDEGCDCADCHGEQDGCRLGLVCDFAEQSCTECLNGNNSIEPREHCDTSVPPSDLGPIPGSSGTWECDPNSCGLIYTCGNGVLELGEQCELGDQFCGGDCRFDMCTLLDTTLVDDGFVGLFYNLPSWRYGMDDASVEGPGDPRPDQFLWFADEYLRGVQQETRSIEYTAGSLGRDDGLPGDRAHHSARWSGTVTVPADGFYVYNWTTRDDAWILVDGVVVDSVRTLQSTTNVRQSSIFLPEGTHGVEIYYASRQAALGFEGAFSFEFADAGLPIRPFFAGCSYCGNGIREPGEVCDDGFRNGLGEGICNTECSGFGAAECGNGIEETGEECDDGKSCADNTSCATAADCSDSSECITRSDDGCSATCTDEPVCGNGVPETGEECDDGKHCLNGAGDVVSCTNDDSVCDVPSECVTVSSDGCSQNCELETVCGDGNKEGAEQCDDGDTDPGDGCDENCQLELVACGNAILDQELDEQCDNGGLCVGGSSDGTACVTSLEALDCALAGGDCLAQDDDGDLCDAECQIIVPVVCGNGIRQDPEECDLGTCSDIPLPGLGGGDGDVPLPGLGGGSNDGGGSPLTCNNNTAPDTCRTDCRLPFCGDNVQDSGEECDTGDSRSDIIPDACRLTCELAYCGDSIRDSGEECDQGSLNHDELPDRCRSDCKHPVCGDGVIDVEQGEECDDENDIRGDGCSVTCKIEVGECGDGNRDPGEDCDDGKHCPSAADNTLIVSCTDDKALCADPASCLPTSGDGCSATCGIELSVSCGDGTVQTENGEQCDDQNQLETDECDNNCQFTVCGDSTVQDPNGLGESEQCDDANVVTTDACTNTCQNAICGDGIVHAGVEDCDDGNTDDTDTCTSLCQETRCGDGTVQTPNSFGLTEECDDANLINTDACTSLCKTALCGDGIVFTGIEECDDGNSTNGDGCSSQCVNEHGAPPPPPASICGNGVLELNEGCDDGGNISGDGCSALCQVEGTGGAICGNGTEEGNEECDDGNLRDNDGCSRQCQDESGPLPPGPPGPGPGPSPAICGNGTREGNEQCDEGTFNSNSAPNACRENCIRPFCGDTVVDHLRGEECDDGGNISGDGCTATCENETAGAVPVHPVAPPPEPVIHPAADPIVHIVEYDDPVVPTRAMVASLLSTEEPSVPKTPGTGPSSIIIIGMGAAAAEFARRRRKYGKKDRCEGWPMGW